MSDGVPKNGDWETYKATFEAKNGQVWVCPACGKMAKNKFDIRDSSCWTWAVLCYQKRLPDGRFERVRDFV